MAGVGALIVGDYRPNSALAHWTMPIFAQWWPFLAHLRVVLPVSTVPVFSRAVFGGRGMSHPADAHVGRRIRHRRWALGFTQEQLAKAVGVRFQQIQKYEVGSNRVSVSRLWDIARYLDVPMPYFFDGLSPRDDGMPEGFDPVNDKEALQLVRAYYAIPASQRRKFFDLAKSLGDDAA